MAPSPRPSATRYDSGSWARTGRRSTQPRWEGSPSSTRPTPSSRTSASATGTATRGGQGNGSVSLSRPRRSYAPGPGRPRQRAHRGRRRGRAARGRGAAVAPARAPCDGPVAAAFCDALRQYILSQNLTAVASNDLTQFYAAHASIQDRSLLRGGPRSGKVDTSGGSKLL